ncbi:bacteriohemerythrin [Trichlorobacter ammonificans]|uniref:Hemerythrin-like metal-binding protein n=1 Tax=Trichlorobacter ammonificans TaxID=2916410 RepID=A0ABN8HFK0_9BACT|nr:bacteriohemerythrin [Trichlorobacter ammonificans]CAH2030063.1 Hemerythrin-like metal-binding protein [Trichlorobacter ammonificans]
MGISWRDDLAIGVEQIDNQHKELMQRFDVLLSACRDGKGGDELRRLVTFLNDYVISHFRDEEALQRTSGFPDYEVHRQEHDAFRERLADLKQRIDQDGEVLVDHVLDTNKMLLDWLIKHISVKDRAIGRYLNRMQ